ncbi:MAG: TonB family protein [Terriglobia bacterium]
MTARRGVAPKRPAVGLRLETRWGNRWEEFRDGVRALRTTLPVLPLKATMVAFRSAELTGRWSREALVLSAALHVLAIVTPVPAFLTRPPQPGAGNAPRIEFDLKWSGNALYLPPISPAPRPKPKPKPKPEAKETPGGREERPLPPRGADAIQVQTIVSTPPDPNSLRQTLLRQNALEEARVRAPEVRLPNVVIPPSPAPAAEVDLRRLHIPGAPIDLTGPPQAPMPPRPKSAAELALERSQLQNLLPRMTLPTATGKEKASTAPEVAAALAGVPRSGDLAAPGLLALSAQPVAPVPVLELPDTNLRARFAAGPFPGSGSPGGAPDGVPGTAGGSGGDVGGEAGGPGGLVVPDILVSPVGPVPSGPVMIGPGGAAEIQPLPPAPAAPAPPEPRETKAVEPAQQSTRTPEERAAELVEGLRPGALPGTANSRRVYTIYINMPNLTSQAGSWVLRFAELGEQRGTAPGGAAEGFALEAPLPVKKVDPGYPSAARRGGVEGTVFLYGIIRADGTVEDVHVVRSLHESLDQRSIAAFRRWRFEPGRKNGTPIRLEVVVEIPFRLTKLF